MANIEVPDMPWGGILKVTATAAAAVFVIFSGLSAAEIQRLKHEKAESERFRWTDAARWE